MLKLFNDIADTAKIGDFTNKLSQGLISIFYVPTHSHFAAAKLGLLALQANPKMSKEAKKWLVNVTTALVTPQFRALCHRNDNSPSTDVATALINTYGKSAEAMRALLSYSKVHSEWKLWHSILSHDFRFHYPEITKEEW